MNNELRTSLIMDLKGNLSVGVRRNERAIQRMSRNGQRNLRGLDRGFRRHGESVFGLIGRYKSLAAVAAGAAASNNVIETDARFTQFGINADLDDKQVEALKRKIFDVANRPDIRVKPSEILGGVEEVVKQTGNPKFAISNLENIGRLISATDTSGRDAGATIANLFNQFDIKKADIIAQSLDTMAKGGKKGAFELADFATQMNTVGAAYASTGRKGNKAVVELDAIMQMVRRTSGSAESAATNFERLISTITAEKVQELRDRNIDLSKSPPDIIKQIIRATGGDEEKLSEVFDIRALRGMRAFGLQFKAKKGFELFDELLAIKGTGETLTADSLRKAKTAKSTKQSVFTGGEKIINSLLSTNLKDMSSVIDKIQTSDSPISEIISLPDKLIRRTASDVGSLNQAAGQLVIDAIRGVFRDEFKATVEIKVEGPATVKKVNRRGRISNFNIDVVQDNGATMVTQ